MNGRRVNNAAAAAADDDFGDDWGVNKGTSQKCRGLSGQNRRTLKILNDHHHHVGCSSTYLLLLCYFNVVLSSSWWSVDSYQ